jgi:RNA polymerase sigma-70 factor, ECF subfamily
MRLLTLARSRSSADADRRFEELYEQYYGRVLAYVLRRTTSGTAEDVVADTFVVAWRRLDRLPDEPLPWLLAIARRTLANQRRTERRQKALIGELKANRLPGTVDSPQIGEVEGIKRAVDRLSELDKELLRLVLWDDLSMKEAATVVGISHAACRVRLHRATRRLAHELARNERSSTVQTSGRFQMREEVKP